MQRIMPSLWPDVQSGLGELGEPLHLELHAAVKPVQVQPRRVPQALQNPLQDHLKELKQQGVIEKVTLPIDWVSGTVVVQKSN